MTVTRRGQLSAELQTLLDVSLYGGGSTNPAISSTKAKTGTYAYRNATNTTPFGIVLAATAAVRAGFWFNHNGNSGGTPPLLTYQVGASLVRVRWNPTSNEYELVLGYQYNSSSFNVAATAAAGAFSNTDTWRHVGAVFKCDGTEGFFSLYVDGARVLTYSGDTTVYRSSATGKEAASITGVYAAGARTTNAWANYAYVDDFYVDDYTGEADAAPSSKRFLCGLVTGAGAPSAEWTAVGAASNYQCVDDATPDDDTTYVKALTAGLVDFYNCADINLPADYVPRAVIPVAVARKTDAGTDSKLTLRLYEDGDEQVGTAQALPTGYGVLWERFPTQFAGTAWTEANINDAQVGIESAGAF